MGWEGWERKENTTDKTLHQSVATEQIVSCDQVVCCLTHTCNLHFICITFLFFFFLNMLCYEYSKVKLFLITVTVVAFCNWVTRHILCYLCCFFGVVNDQCRTNKVCRQKYSILHPTFRVPKVPLSFTAQCHF